MASSEGFFHPKYAPDNGFMRVALATLVGLFCIFSIIIDAIRVFGRQHPPVARETLRQSNARVDR